jgi:hypothetical protein
MKLKRNVVMLPTNEKAVEKDIIMCINPAIARNIWTREEVIAIHKANCERLTNAYISSDIEWIEQNL